MCIALMLASLSNLLTKIYMGDILSFFILKLQTMIQIIRIEHPSDGYGIFRSNCTYDERNKELFVLSYILSDKHGNGKFKTPEEDSIDIYKHNKQWFCAYKTIEQLLQWITLDEIKSIIKHGFNILVLEVTEYQIGQDQVIFTKESIQDQRNLNDLFI
jgi:hypothetical protein